MKTKILFLTTFLSLVVCLSSKGKNSRMVDVCVYGGTSSGVICAYTAKQLGKSVLLIEPTRHLGGLSSGGLGQTDIGNKYVITGLARDFYRNIGKKYGKPEQWTFEPKVAEEVFNMYIKSAKVDVLYDYCIKDAQKKGNKIRYITLERCSNPTEKNVIYAKQFIDCSYEGDLMAKANVSYVIGREANSTYGETFDGVQLMNGHQFPDGIDPYKIKGNPNSGLVYGVHKGTLAPAGSADKKVQAYNFRVTLTNVPENKISISKPNNYNPDNYELLLRLKEKLPWKSVKDVFIWSMMPNNKTDINNCGGFSTDMIGENWNYPEASYTERDKIRKLHEDYTKGLFYFLGNDSRVPESIRKEMQTWGYPKDEYTDNKNFTPQLYIRESRRMLGEYVMTQKNCQGSEIVTDGIGYAAYTMDSHNCDRLVVNGMVKNEGNVEIWGFKPYLISYRSLTPKISEAVNLLVPVCLSASHIAYGSIRMEPVFMELGQVAAIAASISIDKDINVQNVKSDTIMSIYNNKKFNLK